MLSLTACIRCTIAICPSLDITMLATQPSYCESRLIEMLLRSIKSAQMTAMLARKIAQTHLQSAQICVQMKRSSKL